MTRRGFTLIELLVTVVVIAALAALATPPLTEFIRASRLNQAANQLHADLQLARREAIKRNTRVLVCQGTTGNCGTGTAWGKAGWRICYDADFNDRCDATTTADPNPIVVRAVVDESLTVTGPTAAVRFNADGSQGGADAPTLRFDASGTWSGAKTFTNNVAASGHVALAKPG